MATAASTSRASGHDVKLSKKLSYLLRHGAEDKGLRTLQPDGFVCVGEILRLRGFCGVGIDEIKAVVQNNEKKRFLLKENDDGELMIRANQGHSLKTVESDQLLETITDPSQIPVCIHGTNYTAWESIKFEGLKKMKRNNIHFATGEIDDGEVISGMRRRSDVKIYIDTAKAMSDGIVFYRSANNVILCPGVGEDGVLVPKYFKNVIFRNGSRRRG